VVMQTQAIPSALLPGRSKTGRGMRCPNCGVQLALFPDDELIALKLSEREQEVLDRVAEFQRHIQGPVPTRLLADHMGYTPRMVRIWLSNLERLGAVYRNPLKLKSGWMTKHRDCSPQLKLGASRALFR
jgi:hypothetical protein